MFKKAILIRNRILAVVTVDEDPRDAAKLPLLLFQMKSQGMDSTDKYRHYPVFRIAMFLYCSAMDTWSRRKTSQIVTSNMVTSFKKRKAEHMSN
jgi:hypothetical protein